MIHVRHRVDHGQHLCCGKAPQHSDIGVTHDEELRPRGDVADDIPQILVLVERLRRKSDRLQSHLSGTALERDARPQARRREEEHSGALLAGPAPDRETVRTIEQVAQVIRGQPIEREKVSHLPIF